MALGPTPPWGTYKSREVFTAWRLVKTAQVAALKPEKCGRWQEGRRRIVTNLAVQVMRDAATTIRLLASEFGLTSFGRIRIEVPHQPLPTIEELLACD